MAFDKAKVVRAAEKYLSQGNITAAIKEYSQIIEQDPTDFTTLNMLGDLYVRAGQKNSAADCFARIAEHYREQGFVLKAIAMFKKLDRLHPGDTETAHTLATLYDMQGLNVEARAQYLKVAEVYVRTGEMQKSLEAYRKVADLDPNNTEVRVRLAEGYLREGLMEEAVSAFTEAGRQLHAQRADWKALQAYQRALDLSPNDLPALEGLVNSHITLGTADDAAEVLERALAEEPDNVALLRMLAGAYFEAQDATAAERVTATLVQYKAAGHESFVDVARLYLKSSDLESAVRVLTSITEQMLAGREEEKLLKLLDEVLVRDPEQVNALRLLARIHAWQRDDEKLRTVLERLLEAAEAAESIEDQRYALEQLVRVAPDQTHYIDRLQALGGASLFGASQEESRSEPPPPDVEVPTFESFTLMNQQTTIEPVPASGFESINEFDMFEGNSIEPVPSNTSVSFADLNEWTDEGANISSSLHTESFSGEAFSASSVSAGHHAEQPASIDFQDFNFGDSRFDENLNSLMEKESEEAPPAKLDPRREAMRRQELESIDFYIAQGYTDIALDTLEILERQFGPHQDIEGRRAQLQKSTPAGLATSSSVADAPTPAVEPEEVVDFSGSAHYETVADASLSSALHVEIDDSVKAIEPMPSADPWAASLKATARISSSSQPAPPHEPRPASPAAATSASGIDAGLAAIFDDFRTAVEQDEPLSENEDYETHYNLGLAYREMDLIDEAVEEFQLAAALTAQQDGTPRYLQCCNLLGHCFMQNDKPRLAVMWFKKGLDAPGHTEDEYQALRYDLGAAYERLGDLERALEAFTEVYGINVSYRGVMSKLRELEALAHRQVDS